MFLYVGRGQISPSKIAISDRHFDLVAAMRRYNMMHDMYSIALMICINNDGRPSQG